VVTFSASATDAVDGSDTVTFKEGSTTVTSGQTFAIGTHTITETATDSHGNTATSSFTITVQDTTAPAIQGQANITQEATSAAGAAVTFAATATDAVDGSDTVAFTENGNPVASGDTFGIGTHTVTETATDAHGNTTTATFTVTVLYNFTGFFSPVANPPTLNVVNAGRAVPVKFSLSGNKGLNIFAADSPSSAQFTCNDSDPAVDVSQTVEANSNSISYDANADQYNFVWKTDSAWAGTCRQLVVQLNDGSIHRANFKFR
jgi:hypothetical protein